MEQNYYTNYDKVLCKAKGEVMLPRKNPKLIEPYVRMRDLDR
jgi:hypothetical protein